MDVIGALATLDPSTLVKLQYVANYASAGTTLSIPKSKFVIVFPCSSFMLAYNNNGYSIASNQPMLLVPGIVITIKDQEHDRRFELNTDGTVITIHDATYYIFGYCPG